MKSVYASPPPHKEFTPYELVQSCSAVNYLHAPRNYLPVFSSPESHHDGLLSPIQYGTFR